MKAFLTWFLLGAVALGFSFAGDVGRAETSRFRLATFECDVTPPPDGHPLIWVTPVKTVETPLLARGIVLDDGQNRYVLCAVDWCGLCNSSYDLFRQKIADGADTSVSRVAVQCVHPHTAPYTDSDAQRLLQKYEELPLYVDFRFLEEVSDQLAAEVKQSLDRLEPFDRVGTGQTKVDRVASSRRIITPDGKFHGRSSSTKDPRLRALPEGHIDPYLKTITLARGDRPLVRLHYYATHPQSFYGDPRACSDVPGFARKRLEEEGGVFQIYFNGCGGDVAMGKYNDRTPRARADLTDRLYAGMKASAESTRYVPVERLQWRTTELRLPPRTDKGYTLEENRARMADPKQNVVRRVRAATRVAFTERLLAGKSLQLSCLEMGNVAMLHLPGECLVDFQLFAQDAAPDRFVAVAAYGDLGPGYICTKKAFAEGGYEPSASRAGPESEPALKEAIRRLLAEE